MKLRGQKSTVRISPVISQADFEAEVRDVVKHGDIRAIADLTGIGYSHLSQQFNHDDERVSWLFRALQVITALDAIDEQRGQHLWDLFAHYRHLAKGTDYLKEMQKQVVSEQGLVETLRAALKEVR